MKGYQGWSYRPYRPPMREVGDIYICRVVPSETAIHFEWLEDNETNYSVYWRRRGDEAFNLAGTTSDCAYDIVGLQPDTDYEFYVSVAEKRSRIRLARCGKSVGTVINYIHPEDSCYAFSGRYLGSPSLLQHPDGYLLASMDVFARNHPMNFAMIFRSDDGGENWYYVTELMPCFWGKLFLHKGDVYMLACSTDGGDLLIGKSTDGGKTFGAPVCLLRGINGKSGSDGVHKNPQNIVYHGGRLYETLEWGAWANKIFCHAAMVMSCAEDDDLLVPENWSITEPKAFSPQDDPAFADMPECTMTIEGTLVQAPDGKLLNVMRFAGDGCALCYEVDTVDHEAQLRYSRCMKFPAHLSKFMIKFDPVSGRYYSIGDYIYDPDKPVARNYLVLLASTDLETWDVICELQDYREADHEKIGFQYVDFVFEGDDILYLCRTAINGANNFHDSNYSTFHRIKDFRKY